MSHNSKLSQYFVLLIMNKDSVSMFFFRFNTQPAAMHACMLENDNYIFYVITLLCLRPSFSVVQKWICTKIVCMNQMLGTHWWLYIPFFMQTAPTAITKTIVRNTAKAPNELPVITAVLSESNSLSYNSTVTVHVAE